MTLNTHKQSSTIATAARHWFVRMQDDDVSMEEISQWQEWLNADHAHVAAYEKVISAWEVSFAAAEKQPNWATPEAITEVDENDGYSGDVPVIEFLAARERRPFSLAFRSDPLKWIAAMAAVFLISVVSSVSYYQYSQANQSRLAASETFIRTRLAEHHKASMPDGSLIEVGAMSQVSVDYSSAKRSIRLEEGEAFFEVASDSDRPFVVSTPLGNVIAIGTAFNVKLSGDRLLVTVTEGKVKMDVPGEGGNELDSELGPGVVQAGVEAGEAGQYTEGLGIEIERAAPLPESVSWRDNNLSYRTETLKYVFSDLQRYSYLKFEILDDQVSSMQYSGTVRPDRIDNWIEALPEVFPVEIQRTSNMVTIRRREPSGE